MAMIVPADCINNQSANGRNATPLEVFESVRYVLGDIELDPASDHTINIEVKAKRIYTIEDDGMQSLLMILFMLMKALFI